jgi:hypothetical protein
MIANSPVSWRSKQQTLRVMLSMEIEYYAFIKTAKKESSLDYSLQNLVIINQIFIQLEFSEIIYYYIF